MRIRFVCTTPASDGGIGLSMRRLARALTEAGHDCELLVPRSVEPASSDLGVPVLTAECLTTSTAALPEVPELARVLASGAPDALVVGDPRANLLEAASGVAATVLHSHMHWPSCPEAGRYWNHARSECRVEAGWKCLALRPMLGCAGRARVLRPGPVLANERLRRLLRRGQVGVLAVSARQAQLTLDQDVPPDVVSVLPNLGMRLGEDDLERAAATVEEPGTIAYFGRLSKEKGARLLPELADRLAPGARLAVYGSGYLEGPLRASLGPRLRGHVDQSAVAGVLQWARGVVFPSLWPEPGGIVGIDAQLFGVPLVAFGLGAALDWPGATLVDPGDVGGLASWSSSLEEVTGPRPATTIAEAQRRYWAAVADRADRSMRTFVSSGGFGTTELDAVTRDLEAAGVGPR